MLSAMKGKVGFEALILTDPTYRLLDSLHHHGHRTIFICYAPTETFEDVNKDSFCVCVCYYPLSSPRQAATICMWCLEISTQQLDQILSQGETLSA